MNTIDHIKICDGYIVPHSIIKILKKAETLGAVVYLSGVSGCGKTQAIGYYLDKKAYTYYSLKSINIENLEVPVEEKRKTVIIDDLYEIANGLYGLDEERKIRQIICELAMRDDIWLILIGRSLMPQWMSVIFGKKNIINLTEKDLAFDYDMVKKYFEAGDIFVEDKYIEITSKMTLGYPIAVRNIATILQDDKNKKMLSKDSVIDLDDKYFKNVIDRAEVIVWNYLEYNVYDQWETEIQEFLMKLSITDFFDVRMAEMITGRSDANYMIQRSIELGNFIIKRDKYDDNSEVNREDEYALDINFMDVNAYYSLRYDMKASMNRRLNRLYSRDKINRLYYNAGMYFELNDMLPQALNMYELGDNTDKIADILIANSKKNPGCGSYYEFRKYYFKMSEEMIKSNTELICGMSMLQSLMLNIEESERWYEELERHMESLTGSAKRHAKGRTIYLDIALPHRGIVDLVKIFKNIHLLLFERKVMLPEFAVTSNLPSQMNGGKDFCEWSKKDCELAKSIGKIIEIALGKNGKAVVALALAESFFEKGGEDVEVVTLLNKGRMQAVSVGKYDQVFVADGLMTWNMIIAGKYNDAIELLENCKKLMIEENEKKIVVNIDTFIARCKLYAGDMAYVAEWLKTTPDETTEFYTFDRFIYLTKIRAYIALGKYEQAMFLIIKMQYYAEVMKRTYIEMELKILKSICQYRTQDEEYKETLIDALEQIAPYHFVRIISREGVAISKILKEIEWDNTEYEDFYMQTIKETEKVEKAYPGYMKETVDNVSLTDVQIGVLKYLAEGVSKNEISEILHMTLSNVKYHTTQIYKKLGVNGKAAAVKEAKNRGLL